MKWLMKDEIVTFMLDSSPVTSDILKMVCDHIESSSNASTCLIEKVPLSFVFGKQTACINNFLQVSFNFQMRKNRVTISEIEKLITYILLFAGFR